MKKILVILAIIIAFQLQADDQNHPLWQKAKVIAEANWEWIPGTQEAVNIQKNKKGVVKSQEEMIINYALTDNAIESVFVSGKRDDKELDETDPSVAEMLKADMSPDNSSMFHNFEGKDMQVTYTSKTKEINGKVCSGFDYSFYKEDEQHGDLKSNGTVWLDQETGAPLLNEMNIEPPKKMIKEISTNTHYFFDGSDWYINEVVSKFRISALVINVNVESTIKFSDYWKFE